MSLEVIVPVIALIGVLVLVLPGFIQTNYNLKILIKNLSICRYKIKRQVCVTCKTITLAKNVVF